MQQAISVNKFNGGQTKNNQSTKNKKNNTLNPQLHTSRQIATNTIYHDNGETVIKYDRLSLVREILILDKPNSCLLATVIT